MEHDFDRETTENSKKLKIVAKIKVWRFHKI